MLEEKASKKKTYVPSKVSNHVIEVEKETKAQR
jgi:hypothetical protein